MSKQKYEADIKLGERYKDVQTGYEGVAVCVTFWQYGCERIGLESYDAERKDVRIETFDAPRLENIETKKRATTSATGGDHMAAPQRTVAPR